MNSDKTVLPNFPFLFVSLPGLNGRVFEHKLKNLQPNSRCKAPGNSQAAVDVTEQ